MHDHERIARRMSEAVNARNTEAVDEIFTADFYSHPLRGGRDEVRKSWQAILARYPDLTTTVEDVLVDGDRVALRAQVHGIPGTTEPPAILEIIRISDGRIAELWGLTNMIR